MPFIPNIPQPTDDISVSQGQILNNFTILGAIAGNTNASSSSLNANSGFNWVYLPPQGATPPPAALFPAGNIGLYSASDTLSGQNELYVNKTNQATVVQVPMTGSILSSTSTPANNSNGWTYTPSGLLIMWGKADTGNTAAGSYVITLPVGFPQFSRIFNLMLTPIALGSADPNSSYNAQAVLTAGQNFTVYQSRRTSAASSTSFTQFFWQAIGIPTAY
jgi:hypothetical protein